MHTNASLTYNPGKANEEHHTPDIQHASHLNSEEMCHQAAEE